MSYGQEILSAHFPNAKNLRRESFGEYEQDGCIFGWEEFQVQSLVAPFFIRCAWDVLTDGTVVTHWFTSLTSGEDISPILAQWHSHIYVSVAGGEYVAVPCGKKVYGDFQ